jgi:hypothetical protein
MYIITTYQPPRHGTQLRVINHFLEPLFKTHCSRTETGGTALIDRSEIAPLSKFIEENYNDSITILEATSKYYKIAYGNCMELTILIDDGSFEELKAHMNYVSVRQFTAVMDSPLDKTTNPYSYSWNRAMSSGHENFQQYLIPFLVTGQMLDFTDLEEKFTNETYNKLKSNYKPIDYDWFEIDKIKKAYKLQTDLFEGPFTLSIKCKNQLERFLADDISKEMLARTAFLKQIKHKSAIKTPAVAMSDFIQRTGLTHVTDVAKKYFIKCISKINEQSLNEILNEKIPVRTGKRSDTIRS